MERMLNLILVPIDGSKTSHNAIDYAAKLAKSSDAHIHLLNVIDFGRGGGAVDPSDRDIRENRARYILEEAVSITKKYNISVSKEIASGSVPETILSVANEKDFDLIVMGTRGMSGYNNPMLGHVSEKVAQGSKCPVVLV